MILDELKYYNIILASGSPRRKQLLADSGLQFSVIKTETDESYPSELAREQVAVYLAEKKAESVNENVGERDILISSDTIVCINNEILNKPASREEAIGMLKKIAGRMHDVITGVCVLGKEQKRVFYSETSVWFSELDDDEIQYYVDKYKPYDKAGSYGIQEWIGYVGVERIDGSYFNVMGLPMQKLYSELKQLINEQ